MGMTCSSSWPLSSPHGCTERTTFVTMAVTIASCPAVSTHNSFSLNIVCIREVSGMTFTGPSSFLLHSAPSYTHLDVSTVDSSDLFMGHIEVWEAGLFNEQFFPNNQLFSSKWPITVQWGCSYIPLHKESQAKRYFVCRTFKTILIGWVYWIVLYNYRRPIGIP